MFSKCTGMNEELEYRYDDSQYEEKIERMNRQLFEQDALKDLRDNETKPIELLQNPAA